MRQKIRCYNCGAPIPPSAISIEFFEEEDELDYAVLSFECPKCGEPHYIHIFGIVAIHGYSDPSGDYMVIAAEEMYRVRE